MVDQLRVADVFVNMCSKLISRPCRCVVSGSIRRVTISTGCSRDDGDGGGAAGPDEILLY